MGGQAHYQITMDQGKPRYNVTPSDSGHDAVLNPKHYQSHPSGIECLTIVRWFNYNLGCAVKYIWRAGIKSPDPIQDIEKAITYLYDEKARILMERGEIDPAGYVVNDIRSEQADAERQKAERGYVKPPPK